MNNEDYEIRYLRKRVLDLHTEVARMKSKSWKDNFLSNFLSAVIGICIYQTLRWFF